MVVRFVVVVAGQRLSPWVEKLADSPRQGIVERAVVDDWEADPFRVPASFEAVAVQLFGSVVFC